MRYKNESQFANLAKIAFCDGDFDELEKEILIDAAARLEIPPERVRMIIQELDSTPFVPQSSASLRKEEFFGYIEMMEADGIIEPQEKILLMEVGCKLGFTPPQINKALIGKDPGLPGKPDNSFENKTLIETLLTSLAIVMTIILVVWSQGYKKKNHTAEIR